MTHEMAKRKFKDYSRIIEIIDNSNYLHFNNGTLKNLINNFFNIYKCNDSKKKLMTYYYHKLQFFN